MLQRAKRLLRQKVGLQWHWPWAYRVSEPWWKWWLYSTAHDDRSWYWRIFGLEVNVLRDFRIVVERVISDLPPSRHVIGLLGQISGPYPFPGQMLTLRGSDVQVEYMGTIRFRNYDRPADTGIVVSRRTAGDLKVGSVLVAEASHPTP